MLKVTVNDSFVNKLNSALYLWLPIWRFCYWRSWRTTSRRRGPTYHQTIWWCDCWIRQDIPSVSSWKWPSFWCLKNVGYSLRHLWDLLPFNMLLLALKDLMLTFFLKIPDEFKSVNWLYEISILSSPWAALNTLSGIFFKKLLRKEIFFMFIRPSHWVRTSSVRWFSEKSAVSIVYGKISFLIFLLSRWALSHLIQWASVRYTHRWSDSWLSAQAALPSLILAPSTTWTRVARLSKL